MAFVIPCRLGRQVFRIRSFAAKICYPHALPCGQPKKNFVSRPSFFGSRPSVCFVNGFESKNSPGLRGLSIKASANVPQSNTYPDNFTYRILSWYKIIDVHDTEEEAAKLRSFLQKRNIRCRIYVAGTGINGQLSGSVEECEAFMSWMQGHHLWKDIDFVVIPHFEHVLPRATVKTKKQLVASFDGHFNPENRGRYVSPSEWREALESDRDDILVLDVRNAYEWQIGHFSSPRPGRVIMPDLKSFRDFPAFAESLKTTVDPEKTEVYMACTGGIRCEIFSAVMREKGFKNVGHLKGGMINYGLHEGNKNWTGHLYVFDDRITADIDPRAPTYSTESLESRRCVHCGGPVSGFFNCSNIDCNCLFPSCVACYTAHSGCCSSPCVTAPRVRPLRVKGTQKSLLHLHTHTTTTTTTSTPTMHQPTTSRQEDPQKHTERPSVSSLHPTHDTSSTTRSSNAHPLLEWRDGQLVPFQHRPHPDRIFAKTSKICPVRSREGQDDDSFLAEYLQQAREVVQQAAPLP